MKKYLALILALIMVFSLAACGQKTEAPAEAPAAAETPAEAPAAETKEAYKIGISMCDLTTEFHLGTLAAMEAKCDELGLDYVTVVANADANTQNEQVNDLIARGCQAIIIDAVDSAAIDMAVAACNDAGIPVIMNNRATSGSAVPSVQVLSSNEEMAYAEMKWLIGYCKENNIKFENCCMLIGSLGDQGAVERYNGFMKAINEDPGYVTVSNEISTDWNIEIALAGLQNAFKSNPNIDLIVTPSDGFFSTIQSALEEAGRWAPMGEEKHCAIISFDGDADGMRMMRDGYNWADAAQNATATGESCVEWALYFLEGGEPLEEINQLDPGVICTLDNFDEVKESVWGWALVD